MAIRGLKKLRIHRGMPVLVRTSLNAPVVNGKVVEDFRLRSALPTIQYLQKKGARVILASHTSGAPTETLAPMVQALAQWIPHIALCPVPVGPIAHESVLVMQPGDVLVLENLRRDTGEPCNTPAFVEELASLADAFVQDSFDTLHREHASIVGVPGKLPSYMGFQVEKEVKALRNALRPKSPSLAIVGGAKFATKQPVISTLLNSYSDVFIGGALANDFILAKGLPVGQSLVSVANADALRTLLENPRVLLPVDYVVAPKGARRTEGRIAEPGDVLPNEAILDVGPKTLALLGEKLRKARTVLWNGPLGAYEMGFTEGTEGLAELIAYSHARAVVGGGDTVAAIDTLGLNDKFAFVSTGGGAMLDFLAKGTLPGLQVLDK